MILLRQFYFGVVLLLAAMVCYVPGSFASDGDEGVTVTFPANSLTVIAPSPGVVSGTLSFESRTVQSKEFCYSESSFSCSNENEIVLNNVYTNNKTLSGIVAFQGGSPNFKCYNLPLVPEKNGGGLKFNGKVSVECSIHNDVQYKCACDVTPN